MLASIRPATVPPGDGRGAAADALQSLAWSPTQWPANVVPFKRGRHDEAADRPAPALVLDAAARPVPRAPTERRRQIAAFFVLSLALHGGLYTALWEQPKPLASVGIEAITVDIVLGTNSEAGLASTPGENEVQSAAPAEEVKPDDEAVAQQERTTEVRPEIPVTEHETTVAEATEAKPEESTAAMVETSRPETPTALPRETPPELPKLQQPVEKPQPKQKKAVSPERKNTSAGAPSNTASGIGRGRSDSETNYRGLVAAHLTRNKRYPADAERNHDQGTASLSFMLDGSGRVTAAHLVRGSGHASLDQEAQAMVRRASPFPPPPGGRPMSFTVPITFRLQ